MLFTYDRDILFKYFNSLYRVEESMLMTDEKIDPFANPVDWEAKYYTLKEKEEEMIAYFTDHNYSPNKEQDDE